MNIRHAALAIAAGLVSMTFNSLHAQDEIDLSGEWGFQTDVMDFRRGSLSPRYNHKLQSTITLPGITDDYKIGYENPYSYVDRLTRLYEYMAPAWYQRDIEFPASWEGKRIVLYLERTHWLSSVWVDTKEVSRGDYISVPHRHDLTGSVRPGSTHRITICIDNRFQYDTHKWDHAHTEFTQINWNGILGEIKLMAIDPVNVEELQLYPSPESGKVNAKVTVANYTGKPYEGTAEIRVIAPDGKVFKSDVHISSSDSLLTVEKDIPLTTGGAKVFLWDEFHPDIYKVQCTLRTETNSAVVSATDNLALRDDGPKSYMHTVEAVFGMRSAGRDRHHITLNGHPLHLRGTVENAVFPRTGHAPVEQEAWDRIMSIVKSYGLNHMRFHSWCPPDAAFRAADKAGVYFEVEMPMWGKDALPDGRRFDFFRRELKAILKEYGNHPSFLLYCNGNEIQGDFGFIEELTAMAEKMDPRHVYSGSTARTRIPSDQYYISQDTPKGPAKVYEGRPGTDWDINEASDVDVPVISHESGQRCMYPDFSEIDKYDGPVRARNLELWRDMLKDNGMLGQADDFFRASGALTVVEYKAVIEALLRSSLSAGFQLLSLNDFTGQGYAPVGVLDPFWDGKGLVTPEKWREFCSPSVVLLRYAKSSYFSDETFLARAEVYNYSDKALRKAKVCWSLRGKDGRVLASGNAGSHDFPQYAVSAAGDIEIPLSRLKVTRACELTLTVNAGETLSNSWKIWVFPHVSLPSSDDAVLYTKELSTDAIGRLSRGGTVVWIPEPSHVKGRKSVFHNHFWNPIMFAWPPMTLGCLMHDGGGMFVDFPTEGHTDWQWWDILENAKVMELQGMPSGLVPFIQVIDSFDSNKKLGIGFEARACGGRIIVLALDTEKDIDIRPATRQLLHSIDMYVRDGEFNPSVEISEQDLRSLYE